MGRRRRLVEMMAVWEGSSRRLFEIHPPFSLLTIGTIKEGHVTNEHFFSSKGLRISETCLSEDDAVTPRSIDLLGELLHGVPDGR
jgi:hypothetical protein